jgi:hypothetical protein
MTTPLGRRLPLKRRTLPYKSCGSIITTEATECALFILEIVEKRPNKEHLYLYKGIPFAVR